MRVKTCVILVVMSAVLLLVTIQFLGWELQQYEEEEQRNVLSRLRSSKQDAVMITKPDDLNLITRREAKISKLVKKYSLNLKFPLKKSPWIVAADWVKPYEIHPSDAPELGPIIDALVTRNVTFADFGHKGTQLKLTLVLEGGQRVAFKPMWYRRDHVLTGQIYVGRDRHNAEIAAFHLNRLLEFRRAPIVAGRRVNLKTEIIPVATERLMETFFTQDGNTCFYGYCRFCNGREDGVCADDIVMEGAVVLWLPSNWLLHTIRHPWSRSYSEHKMALWETDDKYCDIVVAHETYSDGRILLDLIDAAVFDYLMSNGDRHHYEKFKHNPEAAVILLDNAKSFGNPYEDERSILAPLYHCCRLRESTYRHLVLYGEDGILSSVLRRIMDVETVAPILTDAHYEAIDRRLNQLLSEIDICFEKLGKEKVLVDD